MTTETSKTLSWLLRHGANEAGLTMDAAGWAPVREVLEYTGISRALLERMVAENTKSRFQLDGERVRAAQGHSTAGTPVTAEALEASWEVDAEPGPLWHGTSVEPLAAIAREGLIPQARTHVHLARATDSKVGKRAQVAVMLEISRESLANHGIRVFRAANDVLLVRRVPPDAIAGLRAMTRAARAREAELRALFEKR